MVKKVSAKIFLAIVLILLYLPIIWMVVFSFTDSVSISTWGGFSFKSYSNLFTGPQSGAIFAALINTIIIAVTAGVFATVLGTLAAIGINNMRKKPKFIYNSFSQIPMMNADIITAVSLMLLFVLIRSSFNIQSGTSLISIILAHITFCTPYVVLNVLPRLSQMDKNVYEAALDLGAKPMLALWKVVVPEILPGIILGFLLAITLSIDDFVITNYNIQGFQTLSTYIYSQSAGKKPLPTEIRALSSIIFVLILGILLVLNVKSRNSKTKTIKGVLR